MSSQGHAEDGCLPFRPTSCVPLIDDWSSIQEQVPPVAVTTPSVEFSVQPGSAVPARSSRSTVTWLVQNGYADSILSSGLDEVGLSLSYAEHSGKDAQCSTEHCRIRMNPQKIGLLNYCLWARLELLNVAALNKDKFPITAEVHGDVATMLDVAQKFILPNRADLLDHNSIKQAHLDLTRLPYPITAFEAPWNSESADIVYGKADEQLSSKKRIALCWESGHGKGYLKKIDDALSSLHPEGGIFICPIFWIDEQARWQLAHSGVFLPNGSTFHAYDDSSATAISAIAKEMVDNSSAKLARDEVLALMPVVFCKEVFDVAVQRHGGRDKVLAEVLVNTNDEVNMLIQACALLNCENIETDDLTVSPKLNAKRVKSGKPPFYDYRALIISNENRGDQGRRRGPKSGKVRMHLRRGHIRRLKDRSVWVRDSVIARDSGEGVLKKDYVLKSVT